MLLTDVLPAGMTDVAHKPMTRDALVVKISKWVVSIQAQVCSPTRTP